MSEIMNLKPFCFEKHKRTHFGYCEVVILPCGKIEYVNPSHLNYLEQYMRKKTGLTPTELYNVYKGYSMGNNYQDWMDWLIKESECIPVWYNFYKGKPNKAQQYSLDMLVVHECVDFNSTGGGTRSAW